MNRFEKYDLIPGFEPDPTSMRLRRRKRGRPDPAADALDEVLRGGPEDRLPRDPLGDTRSSVPRGETEHRAGTGRALSRLEPDGPSAVYARHSRETIAVAAGITGIVLWTFFSVGIARREVARFEQPEIGQASASASLPAEESAAAAPGTGPIQAGPAQAVPPTTEAPARESREATNRPSPTGSTKPDTRRAQPTAEQNRAARPNAAAPAPKPTSTPASTAAATPDTTVPVQGSATGVLSTTGGGASITSPPPPLPAPTPVRPQASGTSPAALPASSAVAPPPSPAPPSNASAADADRAAVRGVLERYRQAFSTLNAAGIESFWPGVNRGTVNRAFSQLERQSFEFDSCSIEVAGSTATASCAGRAAFTPRVGNRDPQVESRRWSFRLRRANNVWTIESVSSR